MENRKEPRRSEGVTGRKGEKREKKGNTKGVKVFECTQKTLVCCGQDGVEEGEKEREKEGEKEGGEEGREKSAGMVKGGRKWRDNRRWRKMTLPATSKLIFIYLSVNIYLSVYSHIYISIIYILS